jgi:hypothetical protein
VILEFIKLHYACPERVERKDEGRNNKWRERDIQGYYKEIVTFNVIKTVSVMDTQFA